LYYNILTNFKLLNLIKNQKIMKKVLLVALLAIGVSAASHAQGFQPKPPAEQAAALKAQLSLTDAQTAKLIPIYEAAAKSRDSFMQAAQGGGGDRTAMMASFTKMTNAQNAKIKAILTADQATAFQKQVDEQAAARAKRMQGN
jgi:protein CpxP